MIPSSLRSGRSRTHLLGPPALPYQATSARKTGSWRGTHSASKTTSACNCRATPTTPGTTPRDAAPREHLNRDATVCVEREDVGSAESDLGIGLAPGVRFLSVAVAAERGGGVESSLGLRMSLDLLTTCFARILLALRRIAVRSRASAARPPRDSPARPPQAAGRRSQQRRAPCAVSRALRARRSQAGVCSYWVATR
jgi:hypothetical protein